MWDLTISLYYVNYGLRKRCLEHLTDLILPVYKSQVIHQDFIDQIFNLQFTSICIFLCTWIWANVSNLYQEAKPYISVYLETTNLVFCYVFSVKEANVHFGLCYLGTTNLVFCYIFWTKEVWKNSHGTWVS